MKKLDVGCGVEVVDVDIGNNRPLWIVGDMACPVDVEMPRDAYVEWLGGGERPALVANLEGALVGGVGRVRARWRKGYAVFSREELGGWFASLGGVAVCLANNHVGDVSNDLAETVERLRQWGLGWYGFWNSERLVVSRIWQGSRRIWLLGGVDPVCGLVRRVGKGLRIPSLEEGALWKCVRGVREYDPESMIVVTPHWGYEGVVRPSPSQVAWGRALVDAGADCVVGHHSHRPQMVERYKGRWIVYSVGNFFFPDGRYLGLRVRNRGFGTAGLVYEASPGEGVMSIRWEGSVAKVQQVAPWELKSEDSGQEGAAESYRRLAEIPWYVPVMDPQAGLGKRVLMRLWVAAWQMGAAARRWAGGRKEEVE